MGYIQIAILLSGLLLGGLGGYSFEHSKVLVMENNIKDQQLEAAQILAKETLKVTLAEQTQRNLNLELDKAHEAFINTTNAYSIKQSALIDSLQFTDGRKSGSNSTNKSTSSTINPTDGEEFTWVSKKLLRYLAGESKRAEQDGIDKNELITFVIDQSCGITKGNDK